MAKKLISIMTLCVLMAVSVFSAFAAENETENALVYGDVNLDGDISIIDATDIQEYVVGSVELTEDGQKLADVDGDGRITVMDATAIQKYIAKLDGYGVTGQEFVAE